jgi:mannose-6-phosphate isomerase-like protein (cupin superfamily)
MLSRNVFSAALFLTASLFAARLTWADGDDPGFVVRHDAEVAQKGPGPHEGKGISTGYVFFDDVPGFKISFRKRVLHPGASIGYHKQTDDEVYYIIGGTGKMTINGKEIPAKAGDAFLTRTGSSHSLEQTGAGDLTIIIVYQK